jgi:NAD(P)-dependent dehydrogenase (short-subunit alcohol dehydrogenase family)
MAASRIRSRVIDVVINNAGYGLFGAAEEVTDAQILQQINTNLIGSIQVVRAALPHLREQGGGRIIQISSYGGQATHPGACMYHASKWGIEGFMESTRKDVALFDIGVTIVEPGGARTQFRSGSSQLGSAMGAYDDSPASMTRDRGPLSPARRRSRQGGQRDHRERRPESGPASHCAWQRLLHVHRTGLDRVPGHARGAEGSGVLDRRSRVTAPRHTILA